MDDDQQNESNVLIAWVLGIAVTIAIAVSLIIGVVAALSGDKPAQAPAAAAAGEVDQAPAMATGPGVPQLVKFYFDTGKAELPADAGAQVQAIVDYAKSSPNTKIGISGFHDKTGDAAANLELAKNRAKASRAMLVSAGVPEDRLILVKPQETTGGADDREARRVEVYPAQ